MDVSKAFCAPLFAALAFGVPGRGALAQDDAASGLEEVVVTGSRIQQTGMSTPTPVTKMEVEELRCRCHAWGRERPNCEYPLRTAATMSDRRQQRVRSLVIGL